MMDDTDLRIPDGIEGEAVMPTGIQAFVQQAISPEGNLAILVSLVFEIGSLKLPKLSLSIEGAIQLRDLLTRAIEQVEGSE